MAMSTKKTREPDLGPLGVIVLAGGAPFGFALEPGRDVEVGRDGDLALNHASVSRRHARFEAQGDAFFVRDLGSTNGTRVNGRKLAPNERAPIASGTSLLLGDVAALVQPMAAVRELVSGREREGRALPDGVIARAPAMKELFALLDLVAPSELPLLVLGETGSGKEVVARAIHALSGRKDAPFVALNCASLPESILESELFGYERGAFTGALQPKPGLFESADGGTLFLDEVAETTLATQAKLLRVLETGEVTRLGSVRPKRVDARIVSATNRDLEPRVSAETFRADLYYRLAGMTLRVPPLRERRAEVRPLAELFVAHFAGKARPAPGHEGARCAPRLGDAAARALEARAWPGNVRELRNVMQRAVVLAGASDEITPAHLALDGGVGASSPPPSSDGAKASFDPAPGSLDLKAQVEEFERARIVEALERAQGNQTRAASLLGIARRTLVAKIEQHGLSRPRKGS